MDETSEIDVFNMPGWFNSMELTAKIQLLHRRKAWLNNHVKTLQTELSAVKPDAPERKGKVLTLGKFLAEATAINELIKEYNIQYKNTIDQIMLSKLRQVNISLFNQLLEASKEHYLKVNKLS